VSDDPAYCPNSDDGWHRAYELPLGDNTKIGLLVSGPEGWYCPYCDYLRKDDR
jgi:hypothetical protein